MLPDKMKINKRKIIEYTITSIITIIIIYMLLKNFDFKVLSSIWKKSDLKILIFGNFIYLIICVIRGERYKAAGSAATRTDLFSISAINVFVNRLLPFKTGELIYAYLIKKIGAGRFSQGMVQLIQVRISDLLAIAFLFYIALSLTNLPMFGIKFEILFGVIGILSIILFIFLPLFFKLSFKILSKLINILPTTKKDKILDYQNRLGQIIVDSAKLSTFRKIYLFLVSSVDWLFYYVMFYFILKSFNIDLSFILVILGSSGAIAVSILPVSAIGTFGALEGGWALGFVLVGMPQQEAVATGILMSMVTIVYALTVAITGLAILSIKYKWIFKFRSNS